METLGQTPVQSILFFVLYGVTGVVPLLAALYLLLCPVNAIAPGVTPPVRLRRWTAVFFGVTTLAHVWWLLFYIFFGDLNSAAYLVLAMLDFVLLFVTFAGMLLAMLQDRRRKVWPAMVAVIPFVLIAGAFMIFHIDWLQQIAAYYLILLGLVFTGYMVVSIRQYRRWLNDNYADLENKRVWLCQAVSLVCMLMFMLYVLATDMVYLWLVHIIELVIVVLLLWRVESLPRLSLTLSSLTPDPSPRGEGSIYHSRGSATEELTTPLPTAGGAGGGAFGRGTGGEAVSEALLRYCEQPQLYLQHDLTLSQLAEKVGMSREALGTWFTEHDDTYNAYINRLRIDHFVSLYREAVAAGRPATIFEVAHDCGYRSYLSFYTAFRQRMGISVMAWMKKPIN